jgi:hypothetical protein
MWSSPKLLPILESLKAVNYEERNRAKKKWDKETTKATKKTRPPLKVLASNKHDRYSSSKTKQETESHERYPPVRPSTRFHVITPKHRA